ncbi:MAG TPA: hypothetical protein DCZ91_07865, partial [Lachnospiraceae bacterium]|nr:hypothetical protein [Lachnospiraceae bacterium]
QQLFTLAGILAFTDKLIDEETANKIRRTIEMTKVARIFEEEKLQALAEAAKEKELALAKAEEDKNLAFTKEKKESVFKMLKKNYPSEEIASIISGFTVDEIDTMRREISAQQV